uniref:Chromosome 3 open reading frame 52 n=1 Tax=Pelodiscus sinensis TaxID=13735 RepID=K7GI32_PELSI|nr:TPA-induced transmembrane protein [Pelodiscus sinensis]XP_014425836.1 TPA-induced transmembrane protein [Pelodiscus sinensis]XP_014425837.1 TPA-induced transmembrane protein [Pelodiscus sinensis]|eukprot:XP_006116882.1 TPA-induced transmembrane protein [Pelodiscus sinensis]
MNGGVPDHEHQVIELQEERGLEEENEADNNKIPLNPEASVANKGKASDWRSCGDIIIWKCKLWMVISSIFLGLLLVIIMSLILYSVVYTDEDEYWDHESVSSGNYRNFSGTLKIKCATQLDSSEALTNRLIDVYSSSPALGRYFTFAQVDPFSNENATAVYKLVFSLPLAPDELLKYTLSAEFVMNVLRQNIYDQEDSYDQEESECTQLRLDPAFLTLS